MKALLTSDWHLDAVTYGVPRFLEVKQRLDEMIRVIERERVSHFFFLGDLCDADCPDVLSHLATFAWFDTCLETLSVRRFWLTGNHDVASPHFTLKPFAALWMKTAESRIINKPYILLDSPFNTVYMFLPYPGGELDDGLSGYNDNVEKWVFDTLCCIKHLWKYPLVVFSHLSVQGMPVGEESKEMARGKDVSLPLHVLERHSALTDQRVRVFQGHYHQRQVFNPNGLVPVQVVGSPARFTSLHKEEQTPGFLLVDW